MDLAATKRRKKPVNNGTIDRLPPHSIECERGILGCIFLAPNDCMRECSERLKAESFYDVRHSKLWPELLELWQRSRSIDVITIVEHLKNKKLLDAVGGFSYIASLPDAVPSAANLSYYLDFVVEKYQLRKIIHTCTDVVSRVYDYTGPAEDLLWSIQSDLGNVAASPISQASRRMSVRSLLDYNVDHDENAVIGVREGKTTRYLCRGYGAWLIGPSGIGKSSLVVQQAILWAIGRPFLGIAPLRPLRVLIVQAENDDGDMAEMIQGTAVALGIDEFQDPELLALLDDNLTFVTERSLIGQQFCQWLGRQIEQHRADVVFGDPFLSFAGIDISRQDQCSKFLRSWLNPVLSATGAVMIGAHHTGKPKEKKSRENWTAHDYAYEGIGSSELVNWARAITVVIPHGDHYELKLAKRGARAGAVHPDGETRTTSLWLRHAQDKIFWEQVEPPQEPEPKEHKGGGRPSKVDQLMALGLGPVFDKIVEPIGLNEFAKRIENYAASQHLDVKTTTCKEAVSRLVANGVVKKQDSKYVRS